MKIQATFLVVCAVLVSALPSTKEEGCDYPGVGLIPVRESASVPGKCMKVTCQEGGYVTALTCPLAVAPGCKENPIDYKKPYPDCCPTFEC